LVQKKKKTLTIVVVILRYGFLANCRICLMGEYEYLFN